MFLRCKVRRKDGKQHRYWSVVENTRVAGGRVVQRHVLYLGKINDTQELAWRRSIAVLEEGAAQPRTLSLFPEDRCEGLLADASIVRVKLSALQLRRPRQWGACWLALLLWQDLQLDQFWCKRLGVSRKGTRWDQVLFVLVAYRLLAPRVMCGWPPARKDFFTCLHRRPIAVMCPAWWRGARPQALMGSVDRGLIKPAGSRCPMTRGRYPSIRRLTDDAITLLHPRKSCVFLCFFVRSEGRFSVPTWLWGGAARSRGQDWPKATAEGAREAVLTAVSTAPSWFRSAHG